MGDGPAGLGSVKQSIMSGVGSGAEKRGLRLLLGLGVVLAEEGESTVGLGGRDEPVLERREVLHPRRRMLRYEQETARRVGRRGGRRKWRSDEDADVEDGQSDEWRPPDG